MFFCTNIYSDIFCQLLSIQIIGNVFNYWIFFNSNYSSLSPDLTDQFETDPLFCLDLYADLKDLFRAESYQSAVNPFHRLVWETWMYAFRKLLLQESIRACADTCVDILNAWSKLLPKYIFENILEQLVLVKLRYEVEAWNPLVDPVSAVVWEKTYVRDKL